MDSVVPVLIVLSVLSIGTQAEWKDWRTQFGGECPLHNHKLPNRFIQYLADGTPHVHKCPGATFFSRLDCACVERPVACDKRIHENRRMYDTTYFEQYSNGQWVTMICAPGTAFNQASCRCSEMLM